MFRKERIVQILEEKGWSLYKLCKEAGVAHSTLHDIISGKNVSPTAKTLTKIAQTLDVNVDEFFKDPKEESASKETEALSKELPSGYLRVAKEAQENGLSPEDIKFAVEWFINAKKQMKMHDGKESDT